MSSEQLRPEFMSRTQIEELVEKQSKELNQIREGMYAVYWMASEGGFDGIIDIALDTLQGLGITEQYEKDAENGRELCDDLLKDQD